MFEMIKFDLCGDKDLCDKVRTYCRTYFKVTRLNVTRFKVTRFKVIRFET